jgi:hypothetical protein
LFKIPFQRWVFRQPAVTSKHRKDMSITTKTRKILWGRSGNRCAICKTELVLEKDPFNRNLNIGEECHIISKRDNGPRHQEKKDFDYDDSENLLLLCCNHHTMIDEQVEKFPVEKLIEIKKQHEEWVKTNLDNEEFVQPEEKSRIDNLISYVSAKHDKEMNLNSSRNIFSSSEGLQIAFEEAEKIKNIIKETIEKVNKAAPNYSIIIRDNRQHITDLMFKGKTLLSQFYQAYSNVADDSYLLFAVVNGYFNKDGSADPFYPVTMIEIIRLDFAYNEAGEFGWRNQENKEEFYNSQEITELWIEKFIKEALKEK